MKFSTSAFTGSGGRFANAACQRVGTAYCARKVVNPRLTRTLITSQFRSKWSYYARYWSATLSPSIKTNWETWAATWPYENGLPPNTYMPGFNWFFRNLNKTGDPTFYNYLDYDPGTWTRPTPLTITEWNYDTVADMTTIAGICPDGVPANDLVVQIYIQNPFRLNRKLYPSQFGEGIVLFLGGVQPDNSWTFMQGGVVGPYGPGWTNQLGYFYASTQGNLSYKVPYTMTVT